MKSFLVSIMIFAAHNASAAHDDIYLRYETSAYKLASDAENDVPVAALKITNDEMQRIGLEIMRLYTATVTTCSEQYNVFEADIPKFPSLAAEDIYHLYYKAEGLPPAPRECFFGRSLVVYPAMNFARLVDEMMTPSERAQMADDALEAARYLRTVRQRIHP